MTFSAGQTNHASDAATRDRRELAWLELPPRCREVFTLTRDQHLSYAEVAGNHRATA